MAARTTTAGTDPARRVPAGAGAADPERTATASLVSELWKELAGQRIELVRAFYERLFEQYPRYRELFPSAMSPQREKMVEMLGAVARFADHAALITPYLEEIGDAHRKVGIGEDDLRNFSEVFIEVLADQAGDRWTDAHAIAWREAFDDVILPVMAARLAR